MKDASIIHQDEFSEHALHPLPSVCVACGRKRTQGEVVFRRCHGGVCCACVARRERQHDPL
jgi:hypothetical protein